MYFCCWTLTLIILCCKIYLIHMFYLSCMKFFVLWPILKQNIYVSGNSCESNSRWTGVIEALLENYAVTAGIVPRHPVVSVYFEFLHWVFNCLLTIGQGKKRCSRTMRSQRVSSQGIQSSIYFKFLHFFFTCLLVVGSR